jgi:hypothetical protein
MQEEVINIRLQAISDLGGFTQTASKRTISSFLGFKTRQRTDGLIVALPTVEAGFAMATGG